MAAKFGSKALQGLVFVVLAGGGLLYYSGRLDSFIQVHLRAGRNCSSGADMADIGGGLMWVPRQKND
jgi:hypothetical protein